MAGKKIRLEERMAGKKIRPAGRIDSRKIWREKKRLEERYEYGGKKDTAGWREKDMVGKKTRRPARLLLSSNRFLLSRPGKVGIP